MLVRKYHVVRKSRGLKISQESRVNSLQTMPGLAGLASLDAVLA